MRVALLLSCSSFESFYGKILGHTHESYLKNYRSDWSWYYAMGLIENGLQPFIYIPCQRDGGVYETDTKIPVRFVRLRNWYLPFEWIWFKRLSRRNRLLLYADQRLNTVAVLPALLDALKADSIDILYIQDYWSGRFDHIVHRVSLPVTAADHGAPWRNSLKFFKRSAFAKTPFVYCQTADECHIVTRFGGKAVLQPNGCDTQQFHPDPNLPRSKTILAIGRLNDGHKRTSDIIRALTFLPEDWTLDVVGSGPDLGMLKRLAEEKNIDARVRFRGFVGRGTIVKLLQGCGVYAMPSTQEGLAIAALEAMGCGASVVLSRIKAFDDLVVDGVSGRLVPVGQPKALADAIADAWDKREKFGKAAAETVRERFDSQVLYRELAASLRSVAT